MVPYIGDSRIPDVLVSKLGKILHAGSQVYDVAGELPISPIRSNGSSSSTFSTSSNSVSSPINHHAPKIIPVDIDERYSDLGTTENGKFAPRERFSYWCFDLLFLICSDTTKGWSLSLAIALFTCILKILLLNRSRKSQEAVSCFKSIVFIESVSYNFGGVHC